jgi:hypothetical protein
LCGLHRYDFGPGTRATVLGPPTVQFISSFKSLKHRSQTHS